jgi:hypothetical protein
MRNLTYFFIFLFFSVLIINSCANKPKRKKATKSDTRDTISLVKIDKQDSTISPPPSKIKIANRYGTKPIELFMEKFYTSLELSPEQNRKNYLEGGVDFPLGSFYSCMSKNAKYSKKRVSRLTEEYHDRYHIELIQIDSVKENNELIEVYTNVMYGIYETGSFENLEKITVRKTESTFKVERWEDIKVKKMHMPNAQFYRLENFTERDFYYMVGSLNKI